MPDNKRKQPLCLQILGGLKAINFKHDDEGVSFETDKGVYEISNEGNATYRGKDGEVLAANMEVLFDCMVELCDKD